MIILSLPPNLSIKLQLLIVETTTRIKQPIALAQRHPYFLFSVHKQLDENSNKVLKFAVISGCSFKKNGYPCRRFS
jgi:hypothetical protein